MNDHSEYEIDLSAHLGLWLIHWKKITLISLLWAAAAFFIAGLTFQAPSENAISYRKIEKAITSRTVLEEKLHSAQQSLGENQFYGMDPEALVTKQLTISIMAADQTQLSDQYDPTDLILYAYHNEARTHLYGSVLVPSILTRLQREQLFHVGYDSSANTLTISMTSDDGALIDTVLAAAAQWYLSQQDDVAELTQAHTMTVFPVSATTYDWQAAEEMVSPASAESSIRELEEKISSCNAALDEYFQKQEGWAADITVPMLEEAFQTLKQEESQPDRLSALLAGLLTGAVAGILWESGSRLLRGQLIGDRSIAQVSGWPRIGRLTPIRSTKDPLIRFGLLRLYHNLNEEEAVLNRETAEMLRLLLQDQNIPPAEPIALVGNVSPASMALISERLSVLENPLVTAQLLQDRVAANQVCRQTAAIVFVASPDQATMAEIQALQEILLPLQKIPVGYILVS